ncbi:MAG: glycosyltransferase [Clostridia bacterium]|nr:glycosyltransferase [Clostridia bacterium]
MEQEKLIDILLTTYNSNIAFLRQQIDSILNQSYRNFCLYISDDCSSDNSVIDVLKEYQNSDNRIKLFFQEKNLGFSNNFEFLLNQSTADYIMFSDHDDIWHLDKIQKSLEKITELDVDLVYCDEKQIDESGKVIHESYLKYKNFPIVTGKDNMLAFTRSFCLGCSMIITKELKEKMLPFKSEVIAHDWLACFIASKNKGIGFIEEPLLDYRLHEANIYGGRSFRSNLEREKKR